jgi:hypothetical protein
MPYYRGKCIELNHLQKEPVEKHLIERKFTSDYVPSLCSNGRDLLLSSLDVNTIVQLDINEKPFKSKPVSELSTPLHSTCWCEKQSRFFMLTQDGIHTLHSESSSIKLFSKEKELTALTCSDDKLYAVQNYTTIAEYDLSSGSVFAPKFRWKICEGDDKINSIAYHTGNSLIGLTVRKVASETICFEIRNPLVITKMLAKISLSVNPNTESCLCIPLPADQWLIVGDNTRLLLLDHQGQQRDELKYSEEVLNATVCNDNKSLAIRTPQQIILHSIA